MNERRSGVPDCKRRDDGRRTRLSRLLSTSLAVLLLVSCTVEKEKPSPLHIGAWIVYWDGDRGLSELTSYGKLFDRVSLFAYELDERLVPVHAPHLSAMMPRFFSLSKEKGFSPWVTVVNDIRTPSGVLPKDTEMLRRALSDPRQMKKHVSDIVRKVKEDGFAGVDLDYEGFKPTDQTFFCAFVEELASELRLSGLGLNVIVGPGKGPLPPHDTPLTVMAYNLHGPHSGPGPRSTPGFIKSLGHLCSRSGAAELAIATGGFLWNPGGKVSQMDWSAAKKASLNAEKNGRGLLDRVPYARLADGAELWYEDEKSFAEKWEAGYEAGYRSLMVWRLGGNDDGLFQLLSAYSDNTKRGK